MKLKVVREMEIEALTPTLCGNCPQIETDWPPDVCRLFGVKLERSESEDVGAYLRTEACRKEAVPAAPIAIIGVQLPAGAPPPIVVRTEEDWRTHIGGTPPDWFTKPTPPLVIEIQEELHTLYVGDGYPRLRERKA